MKIIGIGRDSHCRVGQCSPGIGDDFKISHTALNTTGCSHFTRILVINYRNEPIRCKFRRDAYFEVKASSYVLQHIYLSGYLSIEVTEPSGKISTQAFPASQVEKGSQDGKIPFVIEYKPIAPTD